MAIPLRQLIPLQQARLRRIEIGRYLKLDSSAAYIAVAVLCALMGVALITQTARVAQTGEEIILLNKQKSSLTTEQKDLQYRIAKGQSTTHILEYAEKSGMVSLKDDTVVVEYVVLESAELGTQVRDVPVPEESRP